MKALPQSRWTNRTTGAGGLRPGAAGVWLGCLLLSSFVAAAPGQFQQAHAQQTRAQQAPVQQAPVQQAPVQQAPVQQAANDDLRPERIEADISARRIAVESDFAGTRVVIFGAVENSRQTRAESALYDVAVVISGPRGPLVARRKSNVAGIWINTDSLAFDNVPSFYSVLATRPVSQLAPKPLLYQLGIGFENLRLESVAQSSARDLKAYNAAILRIKQQQRLYAEAPNAVSFTGRSLFRATLDLPANVTVGEFTAWIYLFRSGELLDTYKTQLQLQREGFEKFVHGFAFGQPFLYGIAAVIIAVLAGLLASAVFRRP